MKKQWTLILLTTSIITTVIITTLGGRGDFEQAGRGDFERTQEYVDQLSPKGDVE